MAAHHLTATGPLGYQTPYSLVGGREGLSSRRRPVVGAVATLTRGLVGILPGTGAASMGSSW